MKKVLLITLVNLLILGLAGLVITIHYRHGIRKAEPAYSGNLHLDGLQDSVIIRFDRYGVPNIKANNEHDLYLAAGFMTASERMWQMELSRLAVQGRLAEFLGPQAVDYDKLMRTIGFNHLAEQLKDHIDPQSLKVVQAYTDGINAYLKTHQDNLPVEYRLLDFKPEPWKVEYSLGIIRLMAWELNVAWHQDIILGAIYDQVGEQKGEDIFPSYPEDKPFIIHSTGGQIADLMLPFLSIDEGFRKFMGVQGSHIGSNSWVVSGRRSLSGKPILANDPHLGYAQPSRWYEMHLTAPGINVAGVTIPGLPLVVIGHNDSIAWGMTNAMADDADFFVERVDQDNPLLYLYEGQWAGMKRRTEIIHVKGEPDDSIRVRTTHHGPIISDVHPIAKESDQLISMEWMGSQLSDEVTAMYRVNKATNWDEFSRGVDGFDVPGQNFVYADHDGNIGLRVAAKIPIRRHGTGNMPFRGDLDRNEWVGYITPNQMPSLFNPEQGYIATANNKIIDEKAFGHYISNLYEPPSRIERIRELLNSKQEHSVRDFENYQMDCVSPHAREVTPYFLKAFRGEPIKDQYLRAALTWLEKWDYKMDAQSMPATIFNVALVRLIRNVFEDEMGELLFNRFIQLSSDPIKNLTHLLDLPINPWWDDVSTPGFENRDIILQRSLRQAVQWLRDNYGRSMWDWQWGKIHTVTFYHAIGRSSRLVNWFFGLNVGPFERSGSGTTINNGEFDFSHPYENILGPSMRQITDLANPDSALSVIYSGQSGHPLDPHYADQSQLWITGKYHTLPVSEAGVKRITVSTVYLLPEHAFPAKPKQSGD